MIRILVVDDERIVGLLISKYLIDNGYECDACCCIHQAINKLQNHYDYLLTDLNLKNEDGFCLISAVQVHPKAPKCILMTCGSVDSMLIKKAKYHGFYGVLEKPMGDVPKFVAELSKLIH